MVTDKKQILNKILKYMITARSMDILEQEYTARGEAFFHVSGRGHEGIAVIDAFLLKQDWIHAHYRDKALLIARGVTSFDYFLALFNKDESNSCGRQMNSHMSSPENKVLSLVGPVGNNQSQAAGIAAAIKHNKDKPVVFCGVGDGTTSQGEFLEGLVLTIRDSLPVITVIEDNHFAISTYTKGKTFFQVGDQEIESFLGHPIVRIDGRDPHLAYDKFESVVHKVRNERVPAIVVFSVDRLDSHTNADDQNVYRRSEDITDIRLKADPIIRLISYLYDEDLMSAQKKLDSLVETEIESQRIELVKAQKELEPQPIFTAKKMIPAIIKELASEDFEAGDHTMITAMREVLNKWLAKDERVFLYGEDIEDPKGDVFGLTKGLSTKYPDRVVNSPLSESIILGSSIGRALTGQLPVAFLQFADFFPLAVNQIYAELGSMYWRTGGGWDSPVIVLATCGGYKPGLGPFHAASMESMAAHIPGIDVYIPSNAADAAGLLNAAFMSGRPSIFFYPKNLLNTKERTISATSAQSHVIQPGKARIEREGKDITMVGYGNTVSLCKKAADSLSKFGKTTEIIDLRTVSPLDHNSVINSVQKTNKLLMVHEDSGSLGVGAEVLARVGEALSAINMKRVTRRDTYVPCNFSNQLEILPSYKKILETAVTMLDGAVEWQNDTIEETGTVPIEAVGSSPSDEALTIMEWKVKEGDMVNAGQLIAEGEANKADVSIKSSVTGKVKTLLLEEGDTVTIGDNIALIQTTDKIFKTITKEEAGVPHITWRVFSNSRDTRVGEISSQVTDVYMGYSHTVLGSRILDNEQISKMSPNWNPESIKASTGIDSRHWISEDESLVSMTFKVAKRALEHAEMSILDVSGIICATGTHEYLTPSLAAMVQYELLKDIPESAEKSRYVGYAYDISAACSGFVFALSSAYNRIQVTPQEKILLLTGEVLSSRVDMQDYQTAPVFSDAAGACIITSEAMKGSSKVFRPLLQTIGEPGKDLVVPIIGHIAMDGVEVYKVAVRQLIHVAESVCVMNNINITDIDLIVPHQANIKIIKGVARRMKIDLDKFYINIDKHGNSSSNTIPICLGELLSEDNLKGKKVLIMAFGGGFTFGGTILQY